MKKVKLLFVCTENMERRPTAEDLFKDSRKVEAKSCGTGILARKKVNDYALRWADKIFVMEQHHKDYILEHFPFAKKKEIKVLDVLDVYPRNDGELVEILKKKLKIYLSK